MTKVNNSNTPAFFADALAAGNDIKAGSARMDKGEARAIVALVAAWNVWEGTYVVERKKDETDAPVAFTIPDLNKELKNENATKDSKAISARKQAFLSGLFGLVNATAAQDAVIGRALIAAEYLVNAKATPELNSKGQLKVPFELIAPKLPADASDNQKIAHAAMTGKPITLDGTKGNSLRELRNKAVAASPRATRKAKPDTAKTTPEQDLRAAVKFLSGVMQTINSAADESPIAFKSEDEHALFNLQLAIASYFVANPVEFGDERKVA